MNGPLKGDKPRCGFYVWLAIKDLTKAERTKYLRKVVEE